MVTANLGTGERVGGTTGDAGAYTLNVQMRGKSPGRGVVPGSRHLRLETRQNL